MLGNIENRLRARIYEPCIPEVFFDCHLKEQEIAGLWITETAHPPLFNVPTHSHEAPSFFMVLAGSLTEVSQPNHRHVASGTVVFTPVGEIHSNRFEAEGGHCFIVELLPSWTQRLACSYLILDESIKSTKAELEWLVMRLYKEFRYQDSISPLSIEGLTLEILSILSRYAEEIQTGGPVWLRTARELLHDRFSESVKLDEIAAAVGVHPVHLCRVFRQRYSCSFGEYQRRLRVEHACKLLRSTKLSLVQIALTSGFSDQAHLSRVFRRLTGLTPALFRQLSG